LPEIVCGDETGNKFVSVCICFVCLILYATSFAVISIHVLGWKATFKLTLTSSAECYTCLDARDVSILRGGLVQVRLYFT